MSAIGFPGGSTIKKVAQAVIVGIDAAIDVTEENTKYAFGEGDNKKSFGDVATDAAAGFFGNIKAEESKGVLGAAEDLIQSFFFGSSGMVDNSTKAVLEDNRQKEEENRKKNKLDDPYEDVRDRLSE